MDKKKKLLIIGGSAGATALAALVVVSIALANRSEALIARGIANTISDAKKIELYEVANDIANGGSVSVSANLNKLVHDDISVQAKLYTDVKDIKGACEMTLSEDDEAVFQATAILNRDNIAFKAPELFDGTYGINLRKLAKNLPGSIFDPDEETDYALSDEQFDYFMNLHDTVNNNKNLERDVTDMTAKYRQILIERLIKRSTVSRSGKTITIGGEKISCTVVSVNVDGDALALIAQDMVDRANNDKDLENLLYRVAANGSFYDDPDEYVDLFYDSLDKIADDLDDISESDIDIQLDFYITRSGRRLARFDAELEIEDEDIEISIILGKDVSTSGEISLSAENKTDNEGYAIIYTVKEDSAKLYEAEIKFEETTTAYAYIDYDSPDDNDPYRKETTQTDNSKIKIEWEKKSGDFVLKYDSEWDNYVIKGNLLEKDDKYIFVLTSIREDGDAVPGVKSLELTFTFDRHDPAPNIPGNYTEITTMDKRDFKHFINDIGDGMEEFWDKYF